MPLNVSHGPALVYYKFFKKLNLATFLKLKLIVSKSERRVTKEEAIFLNFLCSAVNSHSLIQ